MTFKNAHLFNCERGA